ncbi:MAG: AAA family ATPase [Chitinophagaceae bacterium]
MSQSSFIKDIAKFALENDQEQLLRVLEELIEHSRKSNKVNFAIQLQSILKESIRNEKTSALTKVGSVAHATFLEDRDMSEFILEKLTSDYRFRDLICSERVVQELTYFIQEHRSIETLQRMELPIANKVIFHGPSGCGKTLASYVLAGELQKLMYVVNLGAIVSSKLGETSKNLAKVFRRAATEKSVIFLDEFDSLGKVRDYSQDHGEMKRVVNTILQLFDFMPQDCIVIAATNQVEMIDDALLRRFDVNIKFELPSTGQIVDLITLTLRNDTFRFDQSISLPEVIHDCEGLSYYSIQKTLITAIKRSVFDATAKGIVSSGEIDTGTWKELVLLERKALGKSMPTKSRNKVVPSVKRKLPADTPARTHATGKKASTKISSARKTPKKK